MIKYSTLLVLAATLGCGRIQLEAASKSSVSTMEIEHEDPRGRVSRTRVKCDDGDKGARFGLTFEESMRQPGCGGGYGYMGPGGQLLPGHLGPGAVGMFPGQQVVVATTKVVTQGAGPAAMLPGPSKRSAPTASASDDRVPQLANEVAALKNDITTVKNGVIVLTTIEQRKACREFLKDPARVADEKERNQKIESCKALEGGK